MATHPNEMSDGQYRAIVAYMNFWTPMYANFDLDHAIKDIGITIPRDEVIHQLFKAGHHFNEKTGLLEDHT